jgi:hypothetical protein
MAEKRIKERKYTVKENNRGNQERRENSMGRRGEERREEKSGIGSSEAGWNEWEWDRISCSLQMSGRG